MKKDVFDILETINDRTAGHFYDTGRRPQTVSVSRNAYRRMLEIKIGDMEESGKSTARCYAIREVSTPVGQMNLFIDELLKDTEIGID